MKLSSLLEVRDCTWAQIPSPGLCNALFKLMSGTGVSGPKTDLLNCVEPRERAAVFLSSQEPIPAASQHAPHGRCLRRT